MASKVLEKGILQKPTLMAVKLLKYCFKNIQFYAIEIPLETSFKKIQVSGLKSHSTTSYNPH